MKKIAFIFFLFQYNLLLSQKDTIDYKFSNTNEEIIFYKKFISDIRGFQCPMYPSCSKFSVETFKNNSIPESFIITAERLLRCGHESDFYQKTKYNSAIKLVDIPTGIISNKLVLYDQKDYSDFAYNSYDNNKDSTMEFIEYLINKKYYSEALLEINRFEFFNTFNLNIFINKLICFKSLGKYEDIIYEYNTFLPLEHKENPQILYIVTFSYYLLENYKKSILYDSLALLQQISSNLKVKFQILNTLNYLQTNDIKNVKKTIHLIDQSNTKFSNNTSKYAKYLDNFLNSKNRNPTIAGFLSIIPGLGYLYTNHNQTALSSFLLNSLLAFATVNSFQNNNIGAGIIFGVFNASFYIGNIYGSIKSAKRYNEVKKKKFISLLEEDITN